MPNWCHCSLILKSTTIFNLINFLEDNKENDEIVLSFNKSVSLPDNINDNWYSWRCNNWGTKWDINNKNVQIKFTKISPNNISYELLTYTFYSAWAPPIPWVQKISKLYNNIKFTLVFGDMLSNHAGEINFHNGINIEYKELTYSKYVWNYQINKITMIKSTLNFLNDYINKIVYVIKKIIINSIILINKICINELFLPDELQVYICKFVKYITISDKVISLLKMENIKGFLCNYWELDSNIINTELIPILKKNIINNIAITYLI